MKKNYVCIALLIIATTLQYCKSAGPSSGSPIGTLTAMASEMKTGDFDKMKNYMCAADAKMMDEMMKMVEPIAKMSGMDLKTMMKEQMKDNKDFNFNDVTFKNEKITGDKATVEAVNNKDQKTETLNFNKENGAWKVCMGIADKANEALKDKMSTDPNAPKSMEEMMEKMNDPKMQEEMKKAAEMMKNMKPEDLQKAKELMESMKKN